MNFRLRRDPGAALLGALLVGLLAAPSVFGILAPIARNSWPYTDLPALAPMVIAATLHLGLEAFGPPSDSARVRRTAGVAASTAALLVSMSVFMKAELTFSRGLGVVATVWLGATVAWLAVSLLTGEVGPEARVRALLTSSIRRRAVFAVGMLVFGTMAALAWNYLSTPATFIGEPAPGEIG